METDDACTVRMDRVAVLYGEITAATWAFLAALMIEAKAREALDPWDESA